MKQTEYIDGQGLKEMFATATNWLEKSASDIDALKVLPKLYRLCLHLYKKTNHKSIL